MIPARADSTGPAPQHTLRNLSPPTTPSPMKMSRWHLSHILAGATTGFVVPGQVTVKEKKKNWYNHGPTFVLFCVRSHMFIFFSQFFKKSYHPRCPRATDFVNLFPIKILRRSNLIAQVGWWEKWEIGGGECTPRQSLCVNFLCMGWMGYRNGLIPHSL